MLEKTVIRACKRLQKLSLESQCNIKFPHVDFLIEKFFLKQNSHFEAAHTQELGQLLGVFQKSMEKISGAINGSSRLSGLQKVLVKKEYQTFVSSSNSCSITCRNYMFGTLPIRMSLRAIGAEHYIELRGKRKDVKPRDALAMAVIETLETRNNELLNGNKVLKKKYLGERERKLRRKREDMINEEAENLLLKEESASSVDLSTPTTKISISTVITIPVKSEESSARSPLEFDEESLSSSAESN